MPAARRSRVSVRRRARVSRILPVAAAPTSPTAAAPPRRDASPAAMPRPPATSAAAAGRPKAGPSWTCATSKFDPLGSGPLGTVFKGRHNALGLDVCIKELKDIFGYFSFLQRGEVIKRLKKELCAQAAGAATRRWCTMLDQNVDVARPYFVMELLTGSLREKLEAGGGKGLPVAAGDPVLPPAVPTALRAAHAVGADPPQPQAGERPLRRLRQREARRLRPLAG